MPVVNPGIRRFLASAIQRLFNSAAFDAPLTHSAIPTRAASGTTGTFTRATTATVQNNDGYLVTALAGEARFEGARRVRNLLTYTEDFSNAAWTKTRATISTTAVVCPDGVTRTTLTIAEDGTAANSHLILQSTPTLALGAHVVSVYAKAVARPWFSIGFDGLNAYFDLGTGVVGSAEAGLTSDIEDAGGGWYRCIVYRTVAVSAAKTFALYAAEGNNDLTFSGLTQDSIYIWGAQLEDVTAQTTQTAGEYVSVGVESAPYYHGSFVDGVKCFPTDLSGNPLTTMERYKPELAATNYCLQSGSIASAPWVLTTATVSSNAAAGVDGSLSADLVYPTSSGTFRGAYQAITRSATTHTQHITAKAAGFRWLGILNFNGSGGGGSVWYDLQNGVVGSNTVSAPSVVTPYIRPAGNGFYECGFTGTGAVSQFIQFFCADADGSTTATPSGANGLYIDHTQVEAAAFASSRIATTTIAVTRNADILTYSGGDIPNLKTLAATFKRESGVSVQGMILGRSDGTLAEYQNARLSNASDVRFVGVDGSVAQWDVTSSSYTAGTESTVAWSAATNDVKFAKDGTALTADTSATLPTVTQLDVGHITNAFQLSGNVGGIYGWTRNLSQSELNAVTA